MEENNIKKPKSKKGLVISVIIFLILVILGLLGYIIYFQVGPTICNSTAPEIKEPITNCNDGGIIEVEPVIELNKDYKNNKVYEETVIVNNRATKISNIFYYDLDKEPVIYHELYVGNVRVVELSSIVALTKEDNFDKEIESISKKFNYSVIQDTKSYTQYIKIKNVGESTGCNSGDYIVTTDQGKVIYQSEYDNGCGFSTLIVSADEIEKYNLSELVTQTFTSTEPIQQENHLFENAKSIYVANILYYIQGESNNKMSVHKVSIEEGKVQDEVIYTGSKLLERGNDLASVKPFKAN